MSVKPLRSGSLQGSQPASTRDALEADLAIIARLEGKALPTGNELGEILDVSQTTAHRMIARFRQRGLLKLVDRVRLPDDVCHCIADLRARLLDIDELERLESRLQADPNVMVAAAITGRYNYRITALHRDMAEANSWFKALLAEPAIIDGTLTFCRPIIDRQHYARALLGG